MKTLRKFFLIPMLIGSLILTSPMYTFAATNSSAGSSASASAAPAGSTQSSSQNSAPAKPDGDNGTPPAKPDGDSGTPPAKPDGDNGTPPEKPDGDNGTPPDAASGGGISGNAPGGNPGGAPGSSQGVSGYNAVQSLTSDATFNGETLSSTGTDENVIDVSENASATVANSTVTKTSSDSTGGDNSSFYGVGAALLARSGNLYVTDSKITTDSAGGAGIFAYGDGTAYAADSTINTTKDTSGGIHVAGGGRLYAWDLNVTTAGNSSAAIRSDRGGGTMVVDGGTYTSNGSGSPAVYCTADITANNATLTANGSEALCIEGLNTTRLYDCSLTGNMPEDSQNDCTWNVILYQSMSGDSQEGNSTFEMVGGSLTAKNGGMFYTTNTESTFVLSNVDITYADKNDFFLKCTGNSNQRGWGTSGSNGADCNFTAISQKMEGDVIWDSISQLDMYIKNASSLKGAFVQDESNAGDGGKGSCNVSISSDSTWTVTGDSTVTNLFNEGTIKDTDGKTVTIKGSDGKVYVKGTSNHTVTVTGTYSTKADFSGASTTNSFSDYSVSKPDGLTNVSATTVSTTNGSAAQDSEKENSSIPSWLVISISIGVLILAGAAAILLYSKKQKARRDE